MTKIFKFIIENFTAIFYSFLLLLATNLAVSSPEDYNFILYCLFSSHLVIQLAAQEIIKEIKKCQN